MNNGKRRKRKVHVSQILFFVVVLLGAYSLMNHFMQYLNRNNLISEIRHTPEKNVIVDGDDYDYSEITSDGSNDIYSSNAILIDLANHKVLYSKGIDENTYPASITKIMTTLVAIENISNINQDIILTRADFINLYEQNASMAGFAPSEKVKIIDLLYGTMLPSGADAAMGLANHISGSEEKFVGLMNEKLKELGINNSNFTNVTGLHDVNHYTTVRDLAVFLEYALKNDTFKEIFTAKKYTVKSTNKHPEGITFASTMFKKMKSSELYGGEILGGKTGYTQKAGLCLASLAEKDGKEYILITTGAEGNPYSEQYNITDALNIYNEYVK